MEFKKFEKLFLLQRKIDETNSKIAELKSKLNEKILKLLEEKELKNIVEKIKNEEVKVLKLFFVFEKSYKSYSYEFEIGDFKLIGNDLKVKIYFKGIELDLYQLNKKIKEVIDEKIKELSEKYKVKMFDYEGDVVKLYEEHKEKRNEYEVINELYKLFK